MLNVWLPRATFHHGPDVLRPNKRPKIRLQSDLVPQQRAISVIENPEEGLLRGESRYDGLDISIYALERGVQFYGDC